MDSPSPPTKDHSVLPRYFAVFCQVCQRSRQHMDRLPLTLLLCSTPIVRLGLQPKTLERSLIPSTIFSSTECLQCLTCTCTVFSSVSAHGWLNSQAKKTQNKPYNAYNTIQMGGGCLHSGKYGMCTQQTKAQNACVRMQLCHDLPL